MKLPEGNVIIPGVLDTTTNFIEHPELVAERIMRYASVVGKETMMVGAIAALARLPGVGAWSRVSPGPN